MAESGYYPIGAEDDKNAPWNEPENKEGEIEVDVSITLQKTVKIKVKTYGNDDNLDFDDYDIEKEVEEQIILPNNAYKYISGNTKREREAKEDLSDWDVSELYVELS